MALVSVRVNDKEEAFLRYFAAFKGVNLSTLLRETTLAVIEAEFDARIADEVYQECLGQTDLYTHEEARELLEGQP